MIFFLLKLLLYATKPTKTLIEYWGSSPLSVNWVENYYYHHYLYIYTVIAQISDRSSPSLLLYILIYYRCGRYYYSYTLYCPIIPCYTPPVVLTAVLLLLPTSYKLLYYQYSTMQALSLLYCIHRNALQIHIRYYL